MKNHGRRSSATRRVSPTVLDRINVNVAGIDCGAAEHFVAVPPDRDARPVQSFLTFTSDLIRLAEWLTACRVTSVAMEATGVYWIPLYEILEARGIKVLLVNARHLKNVPGRKSDVSDAEWLRELHSVGLLRGSFRPTGGLVALRAYLRHRETLVESAGIYIQRMQKALVQMNLQLPRVISDITGVTGLRILRDIVAGQRDPHHLATHRDVRCRDANATGKGHSGGGGHCAPPLPEPRRCTQRQRNEPHFEIRTPLHQLTGGVDLTQIDGIGPHTALKLIAEIGTDMSRWPTEKHFTSWLTLAPNNKISGGRLLSSRTQPSANRAAAILRMAASSLHRSQTALSAFYRRLAARIGKAQAITATARKLAIVVYRVLQGSLVYRDPGAETYDLQQRRRIVRRLRQRAAALGFELVNRDTGEISTSCAI